MANGERMVCTGRAPRRSVLGVVDGEGGGVMAFLGTSLLLLLLGCAGEGREVISRIAICYVGTLRRTQTDRRTA